MWMGIGLSTYVRQKHIGLPSYVQSSIRGVKPRHTRERLTDGTNMKATLSIISILRQAIAVRYVALMWALSLPASAATYTWTGAGFMGNPDYLWSNPANWTPVGAPQPGEANVTIVFPNAVVPKTTTNDIVGLSVASIQFQGANYVVAGKPSTNALTLSSGGLGGFSVLASAANCQFTTSCPLVLGSSGGITVASGNTLTIRGRMSGTGGFTKYSAGTLRLAPTQANTFTGSLTVYDGTLDLQGGFFFLGSFFPVTTVPGALVVGNSAAVNPLCLVNEADQMVDTSAVTIGENGELMLVNVDDAIGSLTISGGALYTGSGTITLNGDVTAQLPSEGTSAGQIHGHLHLGDLSRTFNVASNAVLDTYANIAGGNIGNAYAGITKAGLGQLNLAGNNTYPGYTFISVGTINAIHDQALGSTNRPTTVASNAILNLIDDGFGRAIDGEGLTLYGGATLQTDWLAGWNGPMTLEGSSFIEVNGDDAIMTITGVIDGSGGFQKTGTGELVLEGPDNNTFTGTTAVTRGALTLKKGTLASPRAAIGGPLNFGNLALTTEKTVNVLRSESITSGNITVDHTGKLLFGPTVTQTVSTLTINHGEIDTGATGLLKLACDVTCAGDVSEDAAIKGRMDLGNASRTFSFSYYGELDVSASVSGTLNAALNITSPGVGGGMRLSGSNSYQGLTVVQDGMLTVSNPHSLGGTNAGTVVSNSASLFVLNSITNESLHLSGNSDNVSFRSLSGGAIWPSTNSTWRGPVTLQSDTEIGVTAMRTFTIVGPISGPGGFTKLGEGELVLAGTNGNNTYAGTTLLMDGTLTLAKTGAAINQVAIPNDLINGNQFDASIGGGVLRVLGSGQFKTNCVLNGYYLGGEFRFEAGTNSVGTIKGLCDLWFGIGALLKTGFNNDNAILYGLVNGGDLAVPSRICLEKHGSGIFGFSGTGDAHTLVGGIDVKQGNLVIEGSFSNATFFVRPGGILFGQGDVAAVQLDGGDYWPGSANHVTRAGALWGTPGLPLAGSLKLNANHLEVNTAPNVDNLKLDLLIPIEPAPPVGTQFMVISNRSNNPIIGTLNHPTTGANLTEGAKFFDGNIRFSISYVGGNGNDVVVTRVANPVPAHINGISPDPDGMLLNVSGEPGLLYRAEAAFGLGGTNTWTQIGTATMNGSGFANFVDGDGKQYPQRFYRFVVP